jgi:hypothetical protein
VVHETIAQVTQQRTVVRDRQSFDFRGGATVVFDVDGNVKYAIRKDVGADDRLRRQLEYARAVASTAGDDHSAAGFFGMGARGLVVRPYLLRRLHDHVVGVNMAGLDEMLRHGSPEPASPKPIGPAPSQPAPLPHSAFVDLFTPGRQQEVAPLPHRPKIFVSYSHQDTKWLERLEVAIKPLMRDATLALWSDKDSQAGQQWQQGIERALAESTKAILLVSDHFVASDFIVQNELPPLLNGAEQGGILLLCIALSDALYDRLGIGKYQWLNDPKRPLSRLRQPDWRRDLVEIGRQIEQLILKQR